MGLNIFSLLFPWVSGLQWAYCFWYKATNWADISTWRHSSLPYAPSTGLNFVLLGMKQMVVFLYHTRLLFIPPPLSFKFSKVIIIPVKLHRVFFFGFKTLEGMPNYFHLKPQELLNFLSQKKKTPDRWALRPNASLSYLQFIQSVYQCLRQSNIIPLPSLQSTF